MSRADCKLANAVRLIAVRLSVIGLLSISVVVPALGQTPNISVPPRLKTVDEASVDLRSGQSVEPVAQINIGPSDKPVFSYSLTPNPLGWLHEKNSATPLDGGTYQGCIGMWAGGIWMPCVTSQTHFKMGERVEWVANGATTTPDGSEVTHVGGNAILTQRDGTKWTYSSESVNPSYKYGDPTNGWPETAKLKSVTYPNGETLTYTYDTPTGNGTARTRSIVSNQGYILHFDYSSGMATVKMVNLSTEYCAPSAISCAGSSYAFPKVESSQSGSATMVTDAMGRTTTFSGWTATGGTITSPNGVDYKMVYETKGYTFNGTDGCRGKVVVTKIMAAGVDWNYSYDIGSQCEITQATLAAPDGAQRIMKPSTVSEYVDGLGRSTRYESPRMCTSFIPVCVDRDTGPLWYELPEDNKLAYGYDSRFNRTSVTTNPKPGTGSGILSYQAFFDASCTAATVLTCNQPNYTIDANGGRTDYTYHAQSGGIATETAPADANGIRPQTRYSYTQLQAAYYIAPGVRQASGQPIWKLTSKAICRTQASCAGTADEVITSYTYDDNLRPITETVAIGDGSRSLTTTTQYDPVGNVIAVDGPAPGSADTIYYMYNADREQVGMISPDPDGNGGRGYPAVRTVRNADGQPVRVDHGELSALPPASVAPDDWSSYVTFTIFDQIETSYNSYGQKVAEQKREGAGGTIRSLTQFSYDNMSRLQCTAVRMDPTTFDSPPASACDMTVGGTLPDRITKNVYDAVGQLIQVKKGMGTGVEQAYATYDYTPNGKQKTVIDANGNRATLTYDGFDRLAAWYFPSTALPATFNPATQATALATAGQSSEVTSSPDYEAYTYDDNGNRLTLKKRDGRTITYGYDALNRVTSKTYPTGAGARNVYYSYDLRGLQTAARFDSPTGADAVLAEWDGLGRQSSSTMAMGGISRALTYSYDVAGNRKQMTYPEGGTSTISYAYDGLNRLTRICAPALTCPGDATGEGPASIAHYVYNAAGNLDAFSQGQAGAIAANTTITYDGIQRPQIYARDLMGASADGNTTLGYNAASQIISRTQPAVYAYNAYYNVSRGYTRNGLNQYAAVGAAPFGYDANGNLTTTPSPDGTITYGYDIENRLVSSSTGVTLTYDPLGRLYEVATNTGKTTRFAYDGDALIAEYDGYGNLLRRYVHGNSDDDPLAWFEGSGFGDRRLLTANQQGSITAVTQADGTVDVYRYDEYGIPGTGQGGRFQYTGQAWLPELGMSYYKARIYSPNLGRFMQTDPVGYDDQINLYAYVGNDPINGRDPSGTEKKCNGAVTSGNMLGSSGGGNECDDPQEAQNNASNNRSDSQNLLMPPGNGVPRDCDTRAMCQSSSDDLSYLNGQLSAQQLAERRQARADGAATALTAVEGGIAIRGAVVVARTVKMSDLIRWGPTVVPNQILEGAGARGAGIRWTIKGGGGPFKWKYHIGSYNWYKPWTWFKQTPIIKP